MHATPEQSEAAQAYAEALHRLLPFQFFYEKEDRELPDFEFLEGDEVPYPYRSLLVHHNDMTPTLAAFHHSKLYLSVHKHESSEDFVIRLVSLHSAASDRAVEYGAIGIQLANFPDDVKELIREGKMPLGGILAEFGVEHAGSPTAYFAVPADERISEALGVKEGERLFGRCNQLIDRDGMVFADIVEILPRSNESEKWVENVISR